MMTEYQRGYLDGFRTIRMGHDIGLDEAERVDLAEAMGDPMPTPTEQGDYWLGYHHGRFHATSGSPATGTDDRVPSGL